MAEPSEQDPQESVLRHYKKAIVGAAALVGVGLMISTVRRRAANNRLFDQTVADHSRLHPRSGAYAFAIQTFLTSTTLVGCGALAISMGVASAMNVNSFQEFSIAMRDMTRRKYPWLQVSGDQDSPENIQSTTEFMEELVREMEMDDEGYQETPTSKFMHQKIKTEMGPLVP
ncbi:hypothetical protein BASA50_000547 [Batrachochytrium salamandrivorans]|uniref:Altered inheritance of mitochondria protein 11 n=1 Tax=Batrachochytrium salamandrivorans TaxID=1357716 RepID=A0ABQ8ETH6_9FUNG|nr:hypothetical protein BASA62_008226 [Batrachochytrium salamandrivorans]KAH6584033.1 hypothetical protein BASA60_001132 [Batrachochytrium salamandrivorans]KAH6586374.1 hypothetical protein BASA50_000547 [Batrachochytrium salamandrivorans]KAH6593181.1 hypothetical protein BASA61_004328 [Batrachochytrium salamandrivorans]KAH9250172.1 hypothetical protein BASA81_012050 [Batrachochytrium salamandrivorans]